MTHRYTLLTGGTVLAADAAPPATAIAWAEDTVIAIGSDEDVAAISRGDSRFVDLAGATVVPLGADGSLSWPTDGVLEVGGPADLAVLGEGPPATSTGPSRLAEPIALVRAGRVVRGGLPGAEDANDEHAHR